MLIQIRYTCNLKTNVSITRVEAVEYEIHSLVIIFGDLRFGLGDVSGR